jgi:hypothetical protein
MQSRYLRRQGCIWYGRFQVPTDVRDAFGKSEVWTSLLKALLSGGKHAARKLKRAQILLAADAGARDEEIVRSVGVGGSTVFLTSPSSRSKRTSPGIRKLTRRPSFAGSWYG